jgi:hypothetical protein
MKGRDKMNLNNNTLTDIVNFINQYNLNNNDTRMILTVQHNSFNQHRKVKNQRWKYYKEYFNYFNLDYNKNIYWGFTALPEREDLLEYNASDEKNTLFLIKVNIKNLLETDYYDFTDFIFFKQENNNKKAKKRLKRMKLLEHDKRVTQCNFYKDDIKIISSTQLK